MPKRLSIDVSEDMNGVVGRLAGGWAGAVGAVANELRTDCKGARASCRVLPIFPANGSIGGIFTVPLDPALKGGLQTNAKEV
ncbi:hypothetical protein [Ralstonia sp. SET104]|uniref:hypothetical protein n=1 Tax=Ralstonia sp. SET104 TaxID=2448774 RepID=UPI000F578115|nr:hypothetical protein [Ralstonia sp. SET104]GCB04010.1 hypothetical protein PSUB009319_16410 [Ralstonia sp. SET104]